jgi:DNA polymerase-1
MLGELPFKHVWVLDFEYCQADGGLPDPLCMVALDLVSGIQVERWLEAEDPEPCPYDTGPGSLFIGHTFTAEALCHRVLGWPAPAYVIDTYVEIRASFNGKQYQRAGLLEAAARLGIPTITAAAKEAGRAIAMQGRAYAEQHKEELIEYCGSDVETNAALFLALLPRILARHHGLAHSLIFGSFMTALASVEHVGVPINMDLLARLQAHWTDIKRRLVDRFDTGRTDCYVNYKFNRKRFSALLDRLGMLETWPKSETMGWPRPKRRCSESARAIIPCSARCSSYTTRSST